jgi:predicted Zn finger-like uncharacterized protein
MLIVCPSCASEYIIDPAQIGTEGRTVRCAACRETFFVAGEPEITDEELAETEDYNAFLATQAWPEPEPEISVEATSGRSHEGETAPSARRRMPSLGLGRLMTGLRALPRGGVIAASLALLAGGIVVGREPIVRAAPATARLYAAVKLPVNPTGLEFRGVRSELVVNGAEKLLVVEGEIVNVARRETGVPIIELSVRGAERLPLYSWTNDAPRKTLAAAESVRFKTRLASPPSEGREVVVRFAQAPASSAVSARAP